MKYRFIIYLLFIFFYHKNYAQNIKFKNFLTEDGLSNNSVNTIEVDNEGVLWIGTWDGVNYYDGHKFIVYKHIPNDSTSLPNNFIHKIIKDGNNRIWILSHGNKISLVKNNYFKNFDFENKIENIELSNRKEILIKSGYKYYKYHDNRFIRCNKPNIIDYNADIKKGFTQIFPNVKINTSLKDSYGNIWIGSKSNGLFFIPSKKIFNLSKSDIQNYKKDFYDRFSLESNEIYEIREDKFKNIWIGTKDGGLSRVYKNSNSIYFITNHPIKQNKLPSETIRAITVDNEDKIWLGFYRQGVFIQKDKNGEFNKLQLLPSSKNKDWNKIRSLFKASDGSIFGGTYAGIFRYKNGKIDYFSSDKTPYFANNRTYSFYENKEKQIYVASWGGLSLFDLEKNSFVKLLNQSKFSDYNIRDIIEIDNEIFLATEKNGIIIYSDNKISKIDKKLNLLDNSVYSFWYDELNENLWIATLGGIDIYSIIDKKIIKNITEKKGLISHFVYGFLNHKNQVWCSTTHGLITIDRNTYDIFLHPGSEGFQSAEFSEGAYYKDGKDIMYFGGVKGLNFFNPDLLNLDEQLPIIKVCLDNKKPYEVNEKPYKNNYAKFTIDPTFYGESNGNKIYYKLEGYDTNWIPLDYSLNVIDYNNLPAGEYVFKVKNTKLEGKVYKTELVIRKPFWQQLLFYILLFLIILILLIFYLLRKRKLQKKTEKILENKIEDRVKIINQQKQSILLKNKELVEKNSDILKQKQELQKLHAKLKTESMEVDKFYTYIINEYKTPLTKINNGINNLDKIEKVKIETIINELINKILAYEYLSQLTHKDKINETTLEIKSTTERILKDLLDKLNENKIKYKLTKNTDKFWISIDILKFKLLLKYLISDICKFPDKSSLLDINCKIKPNIIEFSFSSDNSVLSENLYHIEHYSPYFQTCKTIAFLMDINLEIKTIKTKSLIKINFKPKLVTPEQKPEIKLNWMHMQLNNQLDNKKSTLLVWSEIEDKSIINQLLPSNYNIIIENKKETVLSILKSISINILVIYNKNLNQEIFQMINHINKKYENIKTIYISENISYEIEYQTMEMGIDSCIQLPVNEKYINKKIENLLMYEKNFEEENIFNRVKKITDINEKNENENKEVIHKSLKIIQNKINDSSFNVTKLSEELNISKIKCYRIFKEILGIPPSEFILEIKLKKAENLLLNSSLNIAEISYEIGFSDPKYFSKVFKKTYGKSPKKYKKSKS